MSDTQHVAPGGDDQKSNRKRKPELDLESVAGAAKQAKGEVKKSKKTDCPACGLKDDEVPDDGLHVGEFCSKCWDTWAVYFCHGCDLFCHRDLRDNIDLCPACRKDSCPECGKCDDCGEHYSKKNPEATHTCPDTEDEEEVPEAKLAKCAICHHGTSSAGFCWQLHNLCTGKCGSPREICRCIQLSAEEELLIRQFHLSAELNNAKYGNVEMGPNWERLLEHAKKVVKMAETNLEAQRKLRAV